MARVTARRRVWVMVMSRLMGHVTESSRQSGHKPSIFEVKSIWRREGMSEGKRTGEEKMGWGSGKRGGRRRKATGGGIELKVRVRIRVRVHGGLRHSDRRGKLRIRVRQGLRRALG